MLAEGLELYRISEVPATYPWIAATLGYVQVLQGEVEPGLALVRDSVAPEVRRRGPLYGQSLSVAGRVAPHVGERREALAAAETGRAIAEAHEERGHLAWAERVMGDILASSEPARAADHYASAVGLAEQLGMRPLLVQARSGLSSTPRPRMRSRIENERMSRSGMATEPADGCWTNRIETGSSLMTREIRATLVTLLLAMSPGTAMAQSGDLIVEKKTFELPSYTTVGGEVIKNVKIGWQAAGTLNADKSNAILITHFYSGTSHAFGKYSPTDNLPGYWDAIIGPGKAVDTDKYYVLSSDTLVNLNVNDAERRRPPDPRASIR